MNILIQSIDIITKELKKIFDKVLEKIYDISFQELDNDQDNYNIGIDEYGEIKKRFQEGNKNFLEDIKEDTEGNNDLNLYIIKIKLL